MKDLRKLKQRKLAKISVEVDSEVMDFYLRSLTAKEWMEITASSFVDDQIQPEAMSRYVAYSLVDEQGNPIMDNEEGVVEVSEWPYSLVKELFNEVQKLNGFFVQQ